ncbi:unnamed protein product [Fusarium equiseti]|uniref:CBM-cenC domain-containing protein n=1 Tax=Fusarium equiseti TaxID=61235 RepID=A0A8J2N6I5_FUSEQ|nr:unnamed protein product [Fusarium equiseti]
MISTKSLAAGLVALFFYRTISSSFAVDLTTTTTETIFPTLFTETTSTAIESSDVSSTTKSAESIEATTSADATGADATTTTEAISTSTEIASTTEQLPPMGTSQVGFGAVYWKRSAPNVMVIRPGRYIAQEMTGLHTELTYRIRFYWVKFDPPSATAGCKVMASFGGSSLGEVVLLPPKTPHGVFEEFYSTPFQPSTTSAELRIEVTCISAGQINRFYVDDVSIEFA